MRLNYHGKTICLDPTWSKVALSLGMNDFTLAEDGFSDVLCQGKEPRPFEKRKSGIYFWRAENGETYIGQAVDIQARLRQHFRNHRDLVYAGYVPFSPDRLDEMERILVAKAERSFPMRNVKLVQSSARHMPFDSIVPVHDQERFTESGSRPEWLHDARREFPMLAVRTRAKRARFEALGERAGLLLSAISQFVTSAIPRPHLTEARFWSVSFPGQMTARINVGQQEVTTCAIEGDSARVRVVAPARLEWFARWTPYETGDFENRFSFSKAVTVFASDKKMKSVRERIIWLARHTTPLHLRSHCPWLYMPPPVTERAR